MWKQEQRSWLRSALLAVALAATVAQAERDSFGLGTGRDGALTVNTSNTVINAYTQVTAPLAPGDVTLGTSGSVVGTGTFAAGDLVMVLQATGLVPEPRSGEATPLDLSTNPVGRWELARLASVSVSTLTLTAPLVHSYAASVTQVIRVPEYTNVTLHAGSSIIARPWDGSTGGIVALLATGTITNNGAINASSAGFRGGLYVAGSGSGCSGLDEAFPGGARKGEGVAATRHGATHTGRGRVANGGGGGVCSLSGGGGGSNAGAGGQGGLSEKMDGDRAVGGQGGVALVLTPAGALEHLLLGGGGGAGHGRSGRGNPGGRGGGIVFIRAQQLSGGTVSANGAPAASVTEDAGSGGGAGGTLYLRLAGSASSCSLSARGGSGASTDLSEVGPGGGGGGGRILFQAGGGSCVTSVGGATPGNQGDNTLPDIRHGATGGGNGALLTLSGGFVSPVVAITSPASGSSTHHRRPTLAGTATPGATVTLFVDHVEVGTVEVDGSGNYSLALTSSLAEGAHAVRARADLQGMSSPEATSTFTVDATPPDTTLLSRPPALSNSSSATSTFRSNESPVTYECSLDGAAFTPCTAPVAFSGLSEGDHTLQVRARDAAGNADPTPETCTWTVDTTPPDTRIDSNPSELTDSTGAAFTFSSHESPVTYECSLEGGAFAACANPLTLQGLGEGQHALAVRAVDAAGNRDPTPATWSWAVRLPVELEPEETAYLGSGIGCSAMPGRGSPPALALLGLLVLGALTSRRRWARAR